MKLKLKQLAILLGGVGATGVASQMGSGVAHASTKTAKAKAQSGDTAWKIAKDHQNLITRMTVKKKLYLTQQLLLKLNNL